MMRNIGNTQCVDIGTKTIISHMELIDSDRKKTKLIISIVISRPGKSRSCFTNTI